MDKRILVNREINTANFKNLPLSWYAAREHFNGYKSVVNADYYNMTSSSGDWEGYIVQRLRNRFYLILFSQTNNYPRSGYTAHTSDVIATWTGKDNPTDEEINNILFTILEG